MDMKLLGVVEAPGFQPGDIGGFENGFSRGGKRTKPNRSSQNFGCDGT
jgi:hypothetical protein